MVLNYDTITLEQATELQNQLCQKLSGLTLSRKITTIAGADISHNKNENTVYAGIVVLTYPGLELVSYALAKAETTFPYIPGFLGFREVPALLKAWELLPVKPDVTVLDGQGITHPRRMGIASHFGVLTDTMTIGCAKNKLYGTLEKDLEEKKFSTVLLYNRVQEEIGYVLRTKNKTAPVFISPGNHVSVPDSLDIMKNCVRTYRIPEPTRLAHEYVNLFRTGKLVPGYHRCDTQQTLW